MSKKAIKCPDHKDRHASAVVFTRKDGSQWLHCLAGNCGASRLYKEAIGRSEKETMESYTEEEYNVEDYGVDVKQCLNPVELLEMLEEEKGISSQAIEQLGGFPTDEGYLGFRYGNGREVYRNLMRDSRPRFINVGGNKGLMGDDILDAWDEVFLVEGLTDWISFKWEILQNVVTSFGAELSEEQAYLLRNKTVFILFDRDFAGYKGARQAAAKLKEYGAIPIILELPDGIRGQKVDVNYLVHKEKESFKKWLQDKVRKYKIFDDAYLETFKNSEPLKFYTTDLPTIQMTQGLYVISGLPGVGKTTLGISLVDRFARQGGLVLYANYDLPKDQIIARLASRFCERYSWTEIEANPSLLKDEKFTEEALKQCLNSVKVMNKLTIDELRYCKKYYTHMIIDYIQRVPNTHNDQRVGLEHIMDALSDMAVEEGMTIVGISRQSLNGNPFSGSAAIEYHAQGAAILSKTDENIISCQTIKNTRGFIGTTLFKVDYPHQRLQPTKLNNIAEEKMKNLLEADSRTEEEIRKFWKGDKR